MCKVVFQVLSKYELILQQFQEAGFSMPILQMRKPRHFSVHASSNWQNRNTLKPVPFIHFLPLLISG